VKVYGQNLDSINGFAQQIKSALSGVDGVKDLYVEPITGGKYLDIKIKREEIGRYGLTIDDVNTIVETALGGMKLTTTVEGRQRFSVNARFGQDYRNNLGAIKRLQVPTMKFGPVPLEAIADIGISEGPPMINSENALLRGTVLFNVRDRDLGGTVQETQVRLDSMISKLPKGYYLEWSGQYENSEADFTGRAADHFYFYVPGFPFSPGSFFQSDLDTLCSDRWRIHGLF